MLSYPLFGINEKMAIQLKGIVKSFGDRTILDGIDLYLASGDKVGLIGPNGCGKTTLVRIVAGLETKDEGKISIPGDDFNLGYLEQFTDVIPGGTLFSEALRGAEKLHKLEARMRQLEEKMAGDDPAGVDSATREYSRVLQKFEHSGGYTFETDVKSILTGLGFREADWTKPAEGLSGGERTRLALARLLAEKPDFILLDEPTNHLDLPAIVWLESTLKSFDGGYLVISHDRRFLDTCCPTLYELEGGEIYRYSGGYEGFLGQKAERLARERRLIKKQAKEIAQLRKFISRWSKDKLRASMAMSRQKKLDKIEANMVEASKRDRAGMHIRFESSVRSFDEVISVRKVSKSFGSLNLFNNTTFSARIGDRLAVIGRNGSGKSTLLRMMIGEDTDYTGEIWWGDRTVWGYFSQTMEELRLDDTVFNNLMDLGRNIDSQEAKDLLGRFLFTGDDTEKIVGDISGGERSKLMFAILLTRKPNCLIIDEPTNHLDLPSREILEEALLEYDGTLIFVSHDRAFIDRLATHTLELDNKKANLYHGNYSDVVYRKGQMKLEVEERQRLEKRGRLDEERREKARSKKRGKPRKGSDDPVTPSPEKIMDEIELLEAQVESLLEELNQPEVYLDYEKAGELNRVIGSKRHEIDGLFETLDETFRE